MAVIRVRRRAVVASMAGAAIVAAGWGLLVLAGRMLGATVPWIDHALMTGIRATLAGPQVTGLALGVTTLGGGRALTIVVLIAALVFMAHRRWRPAVGLCVACWSGGRLVDLAKFAVARPRPEVVEHLASFAGTSFPSGHAANATIVYLSLALLVADGIDVRRWRWACVVGAALLVVTIGCSRVYLGVHWPSDVLAGWLFGIVWVAGWVAGLRMGRAA